MTKPLTPEEVTMAIEYGRALQVFAREVMEVLTDYEQRRVRCPELYLHWPTNPEHRSIRRAAIEAGLIRETQPEPKCLPYAHHYRADGRCRYCGSYDHLRGLQGE